MSQFRLTPDIAKNKLTVKVALATFFISFPVSAFSILFFFLIFSGLGFMVDEPPDIETQIVNLIIMLLCYELFLIILSLFITHVRQKTILKITNLSRLLSLFLLFSGWLFDLFNPILKLVFYD